MAAFIPPAVWFSDRKAKVDALKKNSWYEWTWIAIWLGHITIYGFPGLFWPISFAAYPMFTALYV